MAMQVAETGGVVLMLTPPARCSLAICEARTPDRLSGLRRTVRWFLRSEGVDEQCVLDVVLALHEAVVNGLQHGEGGVEVEIEVRVGKVTTTVRDHGAGFDPALLDPPCPGADEHGRGLYLISRVMDEVAVTDGPRPGLRMVRTI
jgi:serine/threonine-protein kinase RsbW